jgi:hypothetical protein
MEDKMNPAIDFVPGSFTDVFDPAGGIGPDLWRWMWKDDNLIRMETAADLWRVAVEPLQRFLLEDFDPKTIRQHRIRQMLGAMARQILDHRGYEWAGKNYKVPTEDLFTTGSKYRRK